MAIKFGTDGTLYCNSIKYNYKQARNIVYNNCDGVGGNSGWSISNVGAQSTVEGYYSWKCFKFSKALNPIMRQSSFQPTAGHKYYGSVMFRSDSSSFSTGDCRYEWWSSDNNLSGRLTFGYLNASTNGNWVQISSIQTAASSMESGTWIIRAFLTNPNAVGYVCKMIIVDLTDTFGSGNEPTKAWCDANILEHKKLSCAGNESYNPTSSSYSGWSSNKEYGVSLNSRWEPRDSMWYFVTSSSSGECLMTMSMSGSLEKGRTYYQSCEVCDCKNGSDSLDSQCFSGMMRYQFYYPVAEPSMGYTKPTANHLQNGGGGMSSWKRVGIMAKMDAWNSGNYQMRFDFDNVNVGDKCLRVCNRNMFNVNWAVGDYNEWNGTSISVSDVNTEWCDRWLEGRNSPIIHIKDPNKTTVEFKKPLQEIKKSSSSYSRDNLNSYAGMTSDSWCGITNTSSIKTGELGYITLTDTTTNSSVRFIVKVNSISGTTVYTNNYGWGYYDSTTKDNAQAVSGWWEYADGYDIECNDVEIHPEMNSISFDTTGTIKCKRLVTNF